MKLAGSELVALLIAVSFAAGLNLYATVATLGLLAHTSLLTLPPSLSALGNWWVIGAAGVLFAIEFFADKVPAFDLVWNALHTFIRVPAAALLAFQATAGLSPQEQLVATLAGGTIAFIAHGGKTAARAAVTPSPEPEHGRGRAGGVGNLAGNMEAMGCRLDRRAVSDSDSGDGALGDASHAVAVPRSCAGSLSRLR